MILIEDNRAPNPRRVRVFLAEKGIEVERRHLDIMAEEHKTPEMIRAKAGAPAAFSFENFGGNSLSSARAREIGS